MKRIPFRTLWTIAILPLLFGCGDSTTGPDQGSEIETDLTDPAAVVAAYAEALRNRDFLAYAELLDESFEFDPSQYDADDFPWLEGDSWGRVEELGMIKRMFDPTWDDYENPIHTIEYVATVLGTPVIEGNQVLLSCMVQGMVLTNSHDGWVFETRLEVSMILRGSYLRIRKIEEIAPIRIADPGLEASTWGRIKSFFRAPDDLVEIDAVIQAFAAAVRLKDNGALQALFCAAMPNSSAWEFNGATLQELSILEIKNLDAGDQQVTCRAYWQLGPGDGWSAESRLVFLLAHRQDSLCIQDVTPLPEPF